MRESAVEFAIRLVAQGVRSEDIPELAARSGFDVRRVRLRERNWWRYAVLPGIAFLKAGQNPRALIPSSFGYNGLSPETAALLEPDAWLFSPRIPIGVRSLRALLAGELANAKATITIMAAAGIASAACAAAIAYNFAYNFAFNFSLVRLGLLSAVIVLLQLLRSAAGLRLSGKLSVSLVPGIWGRVLRAGQGYFHAATPEEISLAGRSMGPVCTGVGEDAIEFATAFLTAGAVASALIARRGHAGIAMAFAAAVLGGVRMLLRYFETDAGETAEAGERANSGLAWLIVLDILNLRLLRSAERLVARYSAAGRNAVRQRRREYSWDILRDALAAATPAIILFTVTLYPENLASMVSRLVGGALLVWSLRSIDERSAGLFRTAVAARRVTPLLAADSEPDVPDKRDMKLRGSIRLDGVSFAWPGSDSRALDSVSLSIEPGEFICLAGPSGSGKSTLLRLLVGLERPALGEIFYDDEPLRSLDIETVRWAVELVSQEERLMDGTVRINILGSSAGSLEDAWAAAGTVCMDDAIRAMPLGMMTFANEQVFSSSERQRLFIARAMVNRPAILILDETLSGLDEELQARVVGNLRNIPGLTCIVTSHRPSLAGMMDRTFRFDQGRIVSVETGSPLRLEPTAATPPPAEPAMFLPEAIERFHAPEPLDRLVRLWPC